MSQYKTGTVSVTNGSATVTGTDTSWSGNVSAGDAFTIVGSGVTYTVASVSSNTSLTLSAPYAGSTASGQSYAITRDFTADGIVEMSQGDIETATIFTRAVRKIQDLFTSLKTGLTTNKVISAGGDLEIEADTGYVIKAIIDGAERVQVTSSGVVLQGPLANATQAQSLTVSGGTSLSTGGGLVGRGNAAATNPGGVELWGGGAERVKLTAGGDLLVAHATSNGVDKLQINGSASFAGRLNVNSSGQFAALDSSTAGGAFAACSYSGSVFGYLGNGTSLISGGADLDFALRAQSSMVFSSGGFTETMRLSPARHVLINRTTDNGIDALQVEGSVSISKTGRTATFGSGTFAYNFFTIANSNAWDVGVKSSGNFAIALSNVDYVFEITPGYHVFMRNTPAAPAVPSGGGMIYVEAGVLKYIGSSGTITTLAPA
jgi:hypothetical protein